MSDQPSLTEMIDAIIKTFIVAHADDTDAHLAQALVYNAGRLAWRLREQGVDIEQKTSVSDVVTDADFAAERFVAGVLEALPVSYTHLTLPTTLHECRSRWSPYH